MEEFKKENNHSNYLSDKSFSKIDEIIGLIKNMDFKLNQIYEYVLLNEQNNNYSYSLLTRDTFIYHAENKDEK